MPERRRRLKQTLGELQAELEKTEHVDAELRDSYDHARSVARRCARNFYYGMRLTPEPKRAALYAVYAWMHAADELADGPDPRNASGESDDQRRVHRLAPGTAQEAADPAHGARDRRSRLDQVLEIDRRFNKRIVVPFTY